MFGIDFSEILVIFAVALVVLGPQRLHPSLLRPLGVGWDGRVGWPANSASSSNRKPVASRMPSTLTRRAARRAIHTPATPLRSTPTPRPRQARRTAALHPHPAALKSRRAQSRWRHTRARRSRAQLYHRRCWHARAQGPIHCPCAAKPADRGSARRLSGRSRGGKRARAAERGGGEQCPGNPAPGSPGSGSP